MSSAKSEIAAVTIMLNSKSVRSNIQLFSLSQVSVNSAKSRVRANIVRFISYTVNIQSKATLPVSPARKTTSKVVVVLLFT